MQKFFDWLFGDRELQLIMAETEGIVFCLYLFKKGKMIRAWILEEFRGQEIHCNGHMELKHPNLHRIAKLMAYECGLIETECWRIKTFGLILGRPSP